MPTQYLTAGKQNLNFNWNYTNGNLNWREDLIKNKKEVFLYDNLNRLTSAKIGTSAAMLTNYAINGNIDDKTDAGVYAYDAQKINALTSVTNPQLTIPTAIQNVTYTAFYQPDKITQGAFETQFTYGADYERRKSVTKQNGAITNTRFYMGSYEKDVTGSTTRHIHYISAGPGLVAIVERIGTTDNIYYTYTDYLGSILTVTNSSGTVVAEQNFDAWGRRRDPSTWAYTNVPTPPAYLYRGYTGHEQLDQYNLINMNGRLYDPIVGRMLSVDNYVQAGSGVQGYNRYSYALNNPLKYSDPNGEFVLAAVLVGALVGGSLNLGIQAAKGNVNNFKQGLTAFGIGALGGAMASTGILAGPAAISSGISSGLMSAISSNLPSLQFTIGGLAFSVSPAIVLGSHGFGLGANFSVSAKIGDVYASFSYGFTQYKSQIGSGNKGLEQRLGFAGGLSGTDGSLILSSTQFSSGKTSQTVGGISGNIGDFSFSYENDGTPFSNNLGDGGDSYRTAAAKLGYKDFSLNMRLFTGYRDYEEGHRRRNNKIEKWTGPFGRKTSPGLEVHNSEINDYRMGALSIGYKGYEIGWNHDNVRHVFQNKFAHTMVKPQAWIPRCDAGQQLFTQFRTNNPYSLW